MPFANYRDMADCIAKNRDKDDPGAYCASVHHQATGQWPSQKESRSTDFERIRAEFIKYYGPDRGEAEYYAWVDALDVDEAKTYARCLESFSWAKQSLRFWREDASNKYYRVLVGFPTESMNGNVYTEEELRGFAKNVVGVPVDLNHRRYGLPEYNQWLVPGAGYVDANYEDGAVEAVLKVPKAFRCGFDAAFKAMYPQYVGKTVCELIDAGEIVNQSLEADRANPRFFEGSALLTRDCLPGIPMSRIFPLESIVTEAFKGKEDKGNENEKGKNKMTVTVKLRESRKQDEGFPGMPSGNLDDAARAQARKPPEATAVAVGREAAPDNSGTPVEGQVRDAASRLEQSDALARATKAELERMTAEELAKEARETLERRVQTLQETVEKRERFWAKQLEASNAEWERKLSAESKARIEAQTENRLLKEQARQVEEKLGRVEDTVREREKTLIGKDRQIEDIASTRDGFKLELEKLKPLYDDVVAKYGASLKRELDYSRQLAEKSEAYVKAAKGQDELEERLKRAKRLTKIAAKV